MGLPERLSTPRWRNAVLALAGAVLLTVLPFLAAVVPAAADLLVVVPVLLGFGVLEVHERYDGAAGPLGRAGVRLAAIGLGLALVGAVFDATTPDALVTVFLLWIPAVAAFGTLALGSALAALWFRRRGLLGAPTAALLGLSLPLGPLVPILGRPLGVHFDRVVGLPVWFALYGLGWTGLALHLVTTADETVVVGREGASDGYADRSPHVATAGLVGVLLLTLSAGRFLPLGPLGATPWVNQHLALDVFHLATGGAGVAVAATRDPGLARRYARVAGAAYLAAALVVVAAISVPSVGVATAGLALDVSDLVLYLMAGLVLSTVGFVVQADPVDGGSVDADSA